MSRAKKIEFPSLQRIFTELGENIRLARLRRKLPATMVAQRAGIARNTLRAIEQGEPSVTLSAYANVLFVLGLEKDLKLIARDDELGRKLQDAGLPIKARAPRIIKPNTVKKKKDHEKT
jgi:transcriptional regulator with XRE-family HTH domain